jgi:hypothetical protein
MHPFAILEYYDMFFMRLQTVGVFYGASWGAD